MKNEITMTPTNIIILALAVLFFVGAIYRGFYTAKVEKKERQEKYNSMSLETLGNYIVSRNSKKHKIDYITTIQPMILNENILKVTYEVEDGFLKKAISKIETLQEAKERVSLDLANENCSKTPHYAFLNKDGIIHYDYYLTNKEKRKFLFSFDISKNSCLRGFKNN